jgi:uncharacterized membrane protein YozB (DUF420 family)
MSIIDLSARAAGRTRPAFYLTLSLVMAAVIIAGFSRTVPDDVNASPTLPVLLFVHGAVFSLWVVLLVVQPALVYRGSIRLHRRLGMAGAVLATAMVVMGLAATYLAIHDKLVPSFFPPAIFLAMNTIGILVFGALVAAGVTLRRSADWHRRLMMCATVSILGPGVGRLLPMDSFGRAAPMVMFGVIALFGLAGPAYDVIKRGRVHKAYVWGVGAIIVSMLITGPVAFSPPTQALLRWVQGA